MSDTNTNTTNEVNSNDSNNNSLGFINPLPPSSVSSGSSGFISSTTLQSGAASAISSLQSGKSIKDSAMDGAKTMVENILGPVVADGIETAIGIVKGRDGQPIGAGDPGNRTPGGGKRGGDPDFPGNTVGDGYHTHSHFEAGVPMAISWNTPFDPKCYTSRYRYTSDHNQITLHVTGGKLVFPTTPTTDLVPSFLLGATFTEMFYRLQRAINFTMPSTITPSRLQSAMNSLANALQVYYHYSSVLQMGSSGFQTDAIEYDRSNYTPTDDNNLKILKRELCFMPIPPNLRQTCAFLMAHYATAQFPGSPYIKISPVPFATTLNGITASAKDQFIGFDSSYIPAATTDLNTYNDVWNILAKACPSWIGDVGNMPILPEYSPQFSTIWANLPFIVIDTTSGTGYSTRGPAVANSTTEIPYSCWTADLDGAAYAFSAVYNNTSGTWTPSLIQPVSSASSGAVVTSNRFTFNGSNYGFVNTGAGAAYAFATNRPESSTFNAVGSDIYQKTGTSVRLNVTGNTISNTAIDVLDWLLCLPDIAPYTRPSMGSFKGGKGRK